MYTTLFEMGVTIEVDNKTTNLTNCNLILPRFLAVVNLCETNPCCAGAVCSYGLNSFSCQCNNGRKGPSCCSSKCCTLLRFFLWHQVLKSDICNDGGNDEIGGASYADDDNDGGTVLMVIRVALADGDNDDSLRVSDNDDSLKFDSTWCSDDMFNVSTCHDHGNCSSLQNQFNCSCERGWRGSRCEI
ncbi:PREDICTED: fibropellin-1-like, partial [Paramuricea clavata]